MKQIFQLLDTGETELGEVPCPQVKPGYLLIQSRASVISIGTERMVIEFGKANLFAKAKQQPERVKQVFEKIKTDGLAATIQTIEAKLDKPIPLGYSNAGVVIKVGDGVTGFSAGDRVVSNGPHAEIVCVPKNLCAKIPDQVSDEAAAFTVIASIALQGVRLIQPTLGERIVVIGLGLVGLLTVQILQAHGCRVLGVDFDQDKLNLAKSFGAETVNLSAGEDPVISGLSFSSGRGVDGVLITAATKSNEPVRQAAQMCRKRGRIVLIGVAGLELIRQDFYEKELTFQVSCSYGPGRYDPNYEDKGRDYPFEYVRWTEQRNLEAGLEMMADGRLQTLPLTTHRFQFHQALEAYQLICESNSPLGILLQYPDRVNENRDLLNSAILLKSPPGASQTKTVDTPVIAMIGAGEFTTQMLLPILKKTGVRRKTIASLGGLSGTHAGRKFGFETATTDIEFILQDEEVNIVFITTRHENHSSLVCKTLQAGKHIFVEKPLALNREQFTQVIRVYEDVIQKRPNIKLLVGFNRRFSPHVKRIKSLLETTHEPKSIIMTVNAGAISPKHWTQDPEIGGGRIIGEGCHFIDLLRFLVGYPIKDIQVSKMAQNSHQFCADKVSFTLSFNDGSIGTIHYFANGHKSFPKERLEIFCAGRILQLNNFKTLSGYGWPGFKRMCLWRQDKGHFEEISAFIKAVLQDKPSPIPFQELCEVTEASFKVMEMMTEK
jgi:predicted dehydrogenase/threonine dehydrogenase-like Zn-dependent dehydrogenase